MSGQDKRNPPNRQIIEEAAAWFVECREGGLDGAGRKSLNTWLSRSPEHILAYLEVATFWAAAPQMGSKESIDLKALAAAARLDANVVALGPETNTIADRLSVVQVGPAAARVNSVLRNKRRAPQMLLAASIISGLTLVGLSVWFFVSRAPSYTTQTGEQRLIQLADGSTVELNSRSQVRVRYSHRERDVDLLAGQALFNVSKDTTRPFVVHSGGTEVRAVGTEFDVYRRKAGTTVTVVEGRVTVDEIALGESSPRSSRAPALAAGEVTPSSILLSSGEQVTLSRDRVANPTHASVSAATAWTQRRIVFESAPLSDVVEEFNRYNSRQLIIEDPRVADIHIAAVFSSTDLSALVQFLRAMPAFRLLETESEVRIYGK